MALSADIRGAWIQELLEGKGIEVPEGEFEAIVSHNPALRVDMEHMPTEDEFAFVKAEDFFLASQRLEVCVAQHLLGAPTWPKGDAVANAAKARGWRVYAMPEKMDPRGSWIPEVDERKGIRIPANEFLSVLVHDPTLEPILQRYAARDDFSHIASKKFCEARKRLFDCVAQELLGRPWPPDAEEIEDVMDAFLNVNTPGGWMDTSVRFSKEAAQAARARGWQVDRLL